jgi:hypothetical protein
MIVEASAALDFKGLRIDDEALAVQAESNDAGFVLVLPLGVATGPAGRNGFCCGYFLSGARFDLFIPQHIGSIIVYHGIVHRRLVCAADDDQLPVHDDSSAPSLRRRQVRTSAPSSRLGIVAADALVGGAAHQPDLTAIGGR